MPEQFAVLILADNTALAAALNTEHGLSMWVQAGGKHILFDTGMGTALPGNAAALGIDLGLTDTIVLSHGHYDHTGGLPYVFDQGAHPAIFMHPEATRMRYGCLQAPPHKPIGMRPDIAELISTRTGDIVDTIKPLQLADRVWVTGPIPRRTDFEDTGGSFFVDEACRIKDAITDDQALWLETGEGIVVLLGCAHAGVVNTLDYIAGLTGAASFRAVIGGMHLLNASVERLKSTLDALNRYQVKTIAPCHCTGETPIQRIAEEFPAQYARVGAGSRFSWNEK